jgi:serine/threonine protein phosphatase PrpC
MDPAPALPLVEYAERSDPGRDPDKQNNEDVCGRRETRFGHLCVVCDGMGGHAGGREAAELGQETIFEAFELAAEGTPPGQVLRAAMEEANRRVHVMHTSEVGFGRPGCTAVAILVHAHGTEVAHVGDSRAYQVHEGQIFRLTRDHSLVQELVDRGLLTPQQAAHHPDANRITRALGMSLEVDVDLRPQPVHHVPGDAFMLCSDGLSDLVEDDEILAIVGSEPAAQAAGKLVDLANARGGHDNITVVVLRTRESALSVPASVAVTLAGTLEPEMQPARLAAPPTLVDPERTTEPLAAVAAIPASPISSGPPRIGPAPTLPLRSDPAPPPRATVTAIVAVVLASLAVFLLVFALVVHFAERSGKRNGAAEHRDDFTADASPPAPAALAPESVVVPSPPPAREPIAPLEPMESRPGGGRRTHRDESHAR